MSTQEKTKSKNSVRKNKKNNKSNNNGQLRIYCDNIYGNWSDVEVSQDGDNKVHFLVKRGDMVLAEGSAKDCLVYSTLCTNVNRFKAILDEAKKTKKLHKLWKNPEARDLAKSIVELSKGKTIKLYDPLGTIGKAYKLVKELRDAYQKKQDELKAQQEAQAQKKLAREQAIENARKAREKLQEQQRAKREIARAETVSIIAEIRQRLGQGEELGQVTDIAICIPGVQLPGFTTVADLVSLANHYITAYGLLDLDKELKDALNLVIIGPAYGRSESQEDEVDGAAVETTIKVHSEELATAAVA